ncbi:RHS repeat domain-containing protein [Flavobacterium subsaxonicum]
MLVPGRHGNTPEYRYGFNGMEMDDELKGEGNSYTTEFRQYDPRIGRFTSLDPAMNQYAQFSPYSMCFNSPMYFKDTKGDDPIGAIGEAALSFGLSVGLDYLSARILEQYNHEQAMKKINWKGAAYNAGETYAVSLFFSGAGTIRVLNNIRKNKIGKIALEVANEVKDILIDNYTNGNYNDEEGNFVSEKLFNKEEITTIIFQVLSRKLIKYGFEKAVKSIEKSLDKATIKRDRLQIKYDKAISEFTNASGNKIAKKAKKMDKAGRKLAKANNNVSNLTQSRKELDDMVNSDLVNGITNKVADKTESETAKLTISFGDAIIEAIPDEGIPDKKNGQN